MRLPPHWMVAHMGRGVTPHCPWHLSMESFMLNGCTTQRHQAAMPGILSQLSYHCISCAGHLRQTL